MKKLMALAIAVLLIGITGAAVMADENVGSQTQLHAKIHTMGALGYGIATSQANSMDFELIKVGIASVSIKLQNETEELTNVGILYFGESRYVLKDVVIGNGTAAANIYLNGTQKGTISLNSYLKGDREIWAGTLTLDSAAYNAYVIQVPRIWKPAEKAEAIKDYCQNNPEKCKAAIKAVGGIICDPQEEGVSCADKIKTFCEQHPDDNRCKVVSWAYCKLHLEDANCRAQIIEKCKNNTNDTACDKLTNMYNKYVDKKLETLKNAPAWFKSVRERIKNRLPGEIDAEDGNGPAAPGGR